MDNLGGVGAVVNVADGYARNYLLPKKYAVCANAKNVKQIEHQKRIEKNIRNRFLKECGDLATRIEKCSCTLSRKCGDNERLFGSVTSIDIVDALKTQGIIVDRKKILLEAPIKSLGVFTVPIKIHSEIATNLKVWVINEENKE